MPALVTRFAPSPTGPLHLGHAFSALTAWDLARSHGGQFFLRIEDLDPTRSRQTHDAALQDDLTWLGLTWPTPVLRQSQRLPHYAAALDRLAPYTYPCSCTRADIRAALSAPQENAPAQVYPGTCRGRSMTDLRPGDAIRLDLRRALQAVGQELLFEEIAPIDPGVHPVDPDAMLAGLGDVVLGRKDTGVAAYHLAVVVDDAAQGVTHVVRGEDLREATPLHRLLQALLGLPTPVWLHHRLIRDETGRRLAKRDDARALARYRAEGVTPAGIRAMVGL